jgi:hypothetical protein
MTPPTGPSRVHELTRMNEGGRRLDRQRKRAAFGSPELALAASHDLGGKCWQQTPKRSRADSSKAIATVLRPSLVGPVSASVIRQPRGL